MRKHIADYKKRLEEGIGEYMEAPVSERSASAVKSMLECWQTIDCIEKWKENDMSYEDAEEWSKHMENEDGTKGAHWTMEQTSAVADSIGLKFDHIPAWCWWLTMNMMYSDYSKVAEKFGVGTAEFYAEMAKAFLFDKDGGEPEEKIARYYYGIVKPEIDREH